MKNNYFFFICVLVEFSTFGRISLEQKDVLEKNEKQKNVDREFSEIKKSKKEIDTLKNLRKKDSLYKVLHEKYNINTSKSNLKKGEIQYIIKIVKEINFSNKYNEEMIGDLSLLIKILFEGIENNDLNAFEDNNLSKRISILDIKDKMLIPHNPELGINKKKEVFFDFNEVCLFEIISNYVKSFNYPNPILDNLVLKIKIPANNFAEGIERIVCCFKYHDVIDFLIKREYKIKFNGTEMLFADALNKNIFKFIYLFIDEIDVNEKYKIKENDFYKNNQVGLSLIKSHKRYT